MYYFKINKTSELGQLLRPLLTKALEDKHYTRGYVESLGATEYTTDAFKYGDLIRVNKVKNEIRHHFTGRDGDLYPKKKCKELCEQWEALGTVKIYEVNHLLDVSDCHAKHTLPIGFINPKKFEDYLYIMVGDGLMKHIKVRPFELIEITKTEFEEKTKS